MKRLLFGVITLGLMSCMLIMAIPARAESDNVLRSFLYDDASVYINMRYRYENVDQDGFAKEANASTLRTRFGYKTGKLHSFSAAIELENVLYLGSEKFNNTVNGKTIFPIVADPDSTELNHAYITYTGIPQTTFQVGRQPHNLDNQRFIGTVGWRQNDQTYDSAAIINTSLPDTTLIYSYVSNVNRINGDDHPFGDLKTSTHVINLSYTGLSFGKLTAYGYLIDLDDPAVFGLSSKTFGLSFTGKREIRDGLDFIYTAEYANQTEHGDNPVKYSADYYALETGLVFHGLTVKLGYEVLASDNNGTVAFQTPLATLHLFNGWADKFLSTPSTGLEDFYASMSYDLSGLHKDFKDTTVVVAYHDFTAESGGADYGREWDIAIKRKFLKNYSILLKYADYQSDSFASDTQKIWFQAGAQY